MIWIEIEKDTHYSQKHFTPHKHLGSGARGVCAYAARLSLSSHGIGFGRRICSNEFYSGIMIIHSFNQSFIHSLTHWFRCLVPDLQRAGTARRCNSHKIDKLKMLTGINMFKYSVFSCRLKVAIQSIVLKDSGREFHVSGPETLNAVSPSCVLVRSMIKSVVAAERRRLRDGSWLTAVTASNVCWWLAEYPICAKYISC